MENLFLETNGAWASLIEKESYFCNRTKILISFRHFCLLPFFTSSCLYLLPLFLSSSLFIYLLNRAIYKNDCNFSFLSFLLFPKHIVILSSTYSLFISSLYLILDKENILQKQ